MPRSLDNSISRPHPYVQLSITFSIWHALLTTMLAEVRPRWQFGYSLFVLFIEFSLLICLTVIYLPAVDTWLFMVWGCYKQHEVSSLLTKNQKPKSPPWTSTFRQNNINWICPSTPKQPDRTTSRKGQLQTLSTRKEESQTQEQRRQSHNTPLLRWDHPLVCSGPGAQGHFCRLFYMQETEMRPEK